MIIFCNVIKFEKKLINVFGENNYDINAFLNDVENDFYRKHFYKPIGKEIYNILKNDFITYNYEIKRINSQELETIITFI